MLPSQNLETDLMVLYNLVALQTDMMNKIVKKFPDRLKAMLKVDILNYNGQSQTLVKFSEEEGFDEKMGARPLQRLINEKVKLPPAKYHLKKMRLPKLIISSRYKEEACTN